MGLLDSLESASGQAAQDDAAASRLWAESQRLEAAAA